MEVWKLVPVPPPECYRFPVTAKLCPMVKADESEERFTGFPYVGQSSADSTYSVPAAGKASHIQVRKATGELAKANVIFCAWMQL